MNAWIVAAIALLVGVAPLLWVLARADTMSRLVAFEVVAVNVALTFLVLAQAFSRSFYADEALVVAVMSLAGALTFVRMLGRWL